MSCCGQFFRGAILIPALFVLAPHARGAPPVDASSDAARLYRQAFALLPGTGENPALLKQEPDHVALDEATVQFLQQYEPALTMLRFAARLDRAGGTEEHAGPYRRVARLRPGGGGGQARRR